MSSNVTTKLGQFRQAIYSLFSKRRDAIMNLLDALTCNGHQCKSVVQLSNAKSFERQYSSITDAIADGLSDVSWDDVSRLVYQFTASTTAKAPHRFIVDCTPNPRPFARKLADRSVAHHPNPAPGNKPICVGHQYSLLSLLPNEILENQKHWLIPLSVKRVTSDLKGQELGMQQISESVETFDIGDDLFISVGDSQYGTEPCRVKVSEKENWVHIFRLNSSRNVYRSLTPEASHAKGRKKVYGDQMNLVKAKTHLPHDRETILYQTSKKGHPLKVVIKCWNDMVVRGSHHFQSFKHPLNIHQVEVFNEAGDKLFLRPLWIAVFGKRRHEISLEEVYTHYRSRYDIEHLFRFVKTNLLIDKFQTPDVRHEEDWWKLCSLAYIQLYLAKELAPCLPEPWERYLLSYKPDTGTEKSIASPSQTQRGFAKVLEHVGTPAKPCVARGKPRGRMVGEKQPIRADNPVIFKSKQALEDNNSGSEKAAKNSEPKKIATLIKLVQTKLKNYKLSMQEFAEKLLNSS
jgi:hypothetical protein